MSNSAFVLNLHRLRNNFTMQYVADTLKVSKCYISQLENNKFPSPQLACELADLYGIDAHWLLDIIAADKINELTAKLERQHAAALKNRKPKLRKVTA